MTNEIDHLITMYDAGHLSRRQLLNGLLGLGLGAGVVGSREAHASQGQRTPLFRGGTINHVTIQTKDVARSKAFYQALTGLPVLAEDNSFCEFRLDHGFLGLYALEPGDRAGYDHFCLGVAEFEPHRALAALTAEMPDAQPTLEFEDQVYVRDPDGARVQLADIKYKR